MAIMSVFVRFSFLYFIFPRLIMFLAHCDITTLRNCFIILLTSFAAGHSSLFPMEDERSFGDDESGDQGLAGLGSAHCFPHLNGERVERFSRKVFVGGLPPDIDEGKHTFAALAPHGLKHIFKLWLFDCVFQTKSLPVSADLVTWLLTGPTRQRASPTFHPKVSQES